MMHKNFKLMMALIVGLFTIPMMGSTVFAQDAGNIADGEYDIGVTALEDGSDKQSVANDFVHDATLTIENGNPTLTLGIGAGSGEYSDFDFSIEWVTVEGNEPIGASEQGNLTYYTFQLSSLDSIVPAQMEYVVPDFPPLKDGHEVAFDLQLSGLDELPAKGADESGNGADNESNEADNNGATEDNGNTNGDDNGAATDEDSTSNDDNSGAATNSDETSGGDGEEVTNPQTGDSSNILLYAALLIGAGIPLAFIVKKRFA